MVADHSGIDWEVRKTSFSGLENVLKDLASRGYKIYQVIAVHVVMPAKVPFEAVVIAQKDLPKTEQPKFEMSLMTYPPKTAISSKSADVSEHSELRDEQPAVADTKA